MSSKYQEGFVVSIVEETKTFDDVAIPLHLTLRRLGHDSLLVRNEIHPQKMNILFGLFNLSEGELSSLPDNIIIYNLEQLVEGSKGLYPAYLRACSRFAVWDYSKENVERFAKQFGITGVTHVPFGYCPEMTRIDSSYPKDIDVLLYGALNERRVALIKNLRAAGVNAMGVAGAFGLYRDILIARAKVVLNVHYYIPGIQEIIRLGYLWANKKCVVCECNSDTEIHAGFENACIYAPYEELEEKVLSILQQPRAIAAMENAAFLQFSNSAYADSLKPVVGTGLARAKARAPVPSFLNVGSGKNFLPHALNVDISSQWNPDIVLDISQPLDAACTHETNRFGSVQIKPGMFKKIRMFDVLEHVADVLATMTNLLALLEDDGFLHLCVPYELGLGAWQDPTHRHAFNENSWLYYTKWHWYSGWREARFDLENCQYRLSSLGKDMRKNGDAMEVILRTPRAVDAMEVLLRKRPTNFDEKTMYDRQNRACYPKPQPEWSIKGFDKA
ncbi:MAG: methyltransferase domain-containing protein [Desulfovibrio sp.]|nr:methyltransferase domain-containing protein [Desulfovibrio sp.]